MNIKIETRTAARKFHFGDMVLVTQKASRVFNAHMMDLGVKRKLESPDVRGFAQLTDDGFAVMLLLKNTPFFHKEECRQLYEQGALATTNIWFERPPIKSEYGNLKAIEEREDTLFLDSNGVNKKGPIEWARGIFCAIGRSENKDMEKLIKRCLCVMPDFLGSPFVLQGIKHPIGYDPIGVIEEWQGGKK